MLLKLLLCDVVAVRIEGQMSLTLSRCDPE